MLKAVVNGNNSVSLVDFPLTREQIIEGSPVSKIWVNAQTPDKKVTQGVWECTAGRFTWDFVDDEFAMVLEGGATVTPEGGAPITLKVGDYAYFPLGLKSTWEVKTYIKKTFTIRTPEPLNL